MKREIKREKIWQRQKGEKPYVVSKDMESGLWYCHMRGYSYIPVFGSIGTKAKAQRVCRDYNRSCGYE